MSLLSKEDSLIIADAILNPKEPGKALKTLCETDNEDILENLTMKQSDEYETPKWLYDILNKKFNFLIDACATSKNKKAPLYCKDFLEHKTFGELITSLDSEIAEYIYDVGYELDHIYEYIHYDDVDRVCEMQQELFYENYKDEYSIFMNPPYSNPGPFLQQAWNMSKHMRVVCLIPVSILTCRYLDFLDEGDGIIRQWKKGIEIIQLSKRINFCLNGVEKKGVPFGCCLMIMNNLLDEN